MSQQERAAGSGVSAAPANRQAVEQIERAVRDATGRHYRIDWQALDPASLREVLRLLHDAVHEQRIAVNRARMNPWRR